MRAVLTYHSLDESGSVISVTPATFRRHVEWLARGTVSVMPVSALAGELTSSETPRSAVALTFDDGFLNFAEHALPLLRDHAMSATVFVVSDHVGRDNRWGGRATDGIPVLPLLDWDTLGTLSEAGVEIGAHTRTHPHLSRLPETQVEDELFGSAEAIERHTGTRPRVFAYPFGDTNALVERVARRAFAVACTTEFRALRARDDAACTPRLDAWYFREGQSLNGWGSTSFRLQLAMRRGARSARRLVSRN